MIKRVSNWDWKPSDKCPGGFEALGFGVVHFGFGMVHVGLTVGMKKRYTVGMKKRCVQKYDTVAI